MRNIKKVINGILLLLIIVIGFALIFNNKFKQGLSVKAWDNIYKRKKWRVYKC